MTKNNGKLVPVPPKELGRDPMAVLARIEREAPHIDDVEAIHRCLAVVDIADRWTSLVGVSAEPVDRQNMAARLWLERRLGELLKATVKRGNPIVIPDDNCRLPEWVSRNLSSAAQALAGTPKRWFDSVIEALKNGDRRRNIKQIYLEARRMAVAKKAKEAEDSDPEEDEGEAQGPLLDGQIVLGDFREIGCRIPDESVGLVFTDPPYNRESLPLYGDVAALAARVLLPGGSLVVYAPNYALPEILELCGERLRYWWTLAVTLPSDHALMREFGVSVCWKPVVWFTKGGRFNKQQIFDDLIEGQAKEKDEHEWQQQVPTAETLIRALTAEGDLVLDPMSGSATTLLAARQSKRRWLGMEIKPETAALARNRLREQE